MRPIYFFALCLMLLAGCKKEELVVISGNVPPPDSTIATEKISAFVQKVYILLLGREPSALERATAEELLMQASFSQASRFALVGQVLGLSEFRSKELQLAQTSFLNGIGPMDVNERILIFQFLAQQPENAFIADFLLAEVARYQELNSAFTTFVQGSAGFKELHKAICNNGFYDDINMGSLNFVIACYQNFALRNPTENEAAQGVRMVDGFSATLFLQEGNSKSDFLNIFFANDAYHEGLIKTWFNRFLFRQPVSEEQSFYTQLYSAQGYVPTIQRIISSDEFADL